MKLFSIEYRYVYRILVDSRPPTRTKRAKLEISTNSLNFNIFKIKT